MIPKHIFFFWGNDTISWLRYMTLYSCRKLHPDWKISLYYSKCGIDRKPWVEINIQDFFNFDGVNYWNKIKELDINIIPWDIKGYEKLSASHKSNIFKWHMLATEGGVYADMDILFIKPVDILLEQDCTDIICAHKWISIGVLASMGNSKLFKAFLDKAPLTYNKKEYQCVGVKSCYTTLYGRCTEDVIQNRNHIETLRKKFPDSVIFNLPMSWFYHYTYRDLNKIFSETVKMPNEALGIHWYAGNPLSQKWNNLLTDENFKNYPNTITSYIGDML